VFENYFAGGFSTIRGYAFRGASPRDFGVIVGGRFQWLNSAEYYFPLTADDMIRGTIFCDFGTVERNVAVHSDQFRVAPGFGFRINIPAMGPAPLAFDFAFPIASADTDREQIFSFFFGASR
jgi:outer membrane protein insertion porin family